MLDHVGQSYHYFMAAHNRHKHTPFTTSMNSNARFWQVEHRRPHCWVHSRSSKDGWQAQQARSVLQHYTLLERQRHAAHGWHLHRSYHAVVSWTSMDTRDIALKILVLAGEMDLHPMLGSPTWRDQTQSQWKRWELQKLCPWHGCYCRSVKAKVLTKRFAYVRENDNRHRGHI